MGVLFQLALRGDSGGHVALDALDLQARRFFALDAVVAPAPALPLDDICTLEPIETAGGTWFHCARHGWAGGFVRRGAALSFPVCPLEGR